MRVLEIVTVLLVVIATALPLAHALERPGKMRLDRDQYLAVQSIYYPGFTAAAGIGEFGGQIATLLLLILTARPSPAFALTVAALIALIAMHAVYWIVTHPINKVWLRQERLGRLGSGFFSVGSRTAAAGRDGDAAEWTALRDRWEFSHIVRAGLAAVGLTLLIVRIAWR